MSDIEFGGGGRRLAPRHDTTPPGPDLGGALARGDIETFYQPVIELASRAVVGFEALARWRGGDAVEVSPDEFLSARQKPTLVAEIGRLMSQRALEQLHQWRSADQGPVGLYVSVNVSLSELESPQFLPELEARLSTTSVPVSALRLEIIEREAMRNPELVISQLNRLKAIGVVALLDDFGSGHSSLAWLSQLPVQGLKIDQAFVRGLPEDTASASIIRALMRMAFDLNLTVIAEGIETAAAADALAAFGCRYGQGYLYAPPLSAEAATAFLIASAKA